MTLLNDEDPAEPSVHEPRVIDPPATLWLVYGDIEQDATHRECCRSGEVTWCEDSQSSSDVQYTRTDIVAQQVSAAVAAEHARMCGHIRGAMGHAEAGYDDVAWRLLESLVGPNAELTGAPLGAPGARRPVARPVE